MSDGELKKRMWQSGQRYHVVEGFWGNIEDPDYLDPNVVQKVLDKVAKEYPKISTLNLPKDFTNRESILRILAEETDNWFKKWFGEGK